MGVFLHVINSGKAYALQQYVRNMQYKKDDVVAALRDILESEVFRSSPRSQAFLKYVVTETIEGRGEQLSGTTIAQDVYEKDSDFDPGQDTLIRVGARRLRSMLRDYYIDHPDRDAVTLSMPKGSYKIVIKPNAPAKSVLDARVPEAQSLAGPVRDTPDLEPPKSCVPRRSGNRET